MFAASPVSLYVGPAAVPTGAKLVHPAPWHRSTGYPVTPTLSVDAVQLRLIWLPLTAVADSVPGAVGACVSSAGVGALATFESPLRSPAASVARPPWLSLPSRRSSAPLYVGPAAVPTGAKLVHPAPWHRSTGYPVTPTLSIDAVQLRLIWLPLTAVAVSVPGAVGGCVSGVAGATAVFMSVWISAAVSARL